MKQGSTKSSNKRLLATKKASAKPKSSRALRFREVSGRELEANRNSAYAYLIQ